MVSHHKDLPDESEPMTNPTFPPAGWYPDADNTAQSKWWDGTAWQEENPRPRSPLRSPLSWIAAGLLVIGFIPLVEGAPAFTLNLNLPALVLGIIATSRSKSRSWLSIVVLCCAVHCGRGRGREYDRGLCFRQQQ